MKTIVQPLSVSPLQIERHEFLEIELHSAEEEGAHKSLALKVDRSFALHQSDPLRYRVELTVRFGEIKDGKPSVYSGRLRIAGYFRINEQYPAAKISQLVEVTGPSILYGACREMLANLTSRAGHGTVSLPSVSFMPPAEGEPEKSAVRLAKGEGEATRKRGTAKKRSAK